ncbi:protein DMP6-like [Aristolochia californica]|uniref:protein DMP6-like n=1 Tax=Aristolochia californica TaxID=171875 RepID=UPI0035E0C030
MEIKIEDAAAQHHQPLLQGENVSTSGPARSPVQNAIHQTFKSTAHLANLLPTGTVLAFQLLSPVFTNQGKCNSTNQYITKCLTVLCGISCFLLSFTDSYRDGEGKVRYGLATMNGLWVIDGEDNNTLHPEVARKYKMKFIDFVHAIMSIMVFGVVVLFDQNVVKCFCPEPSEETKQVLTGLPVGIGVICSMLFIAFPTTRHGIGFPLSRH